jgi:ribosome maturation factor RimP
MITRERVKEVVSKEIEEKGFFIVEVKVKSGNRIFVEIDSIDTVSIKDCVDLSKSFEKHFDRDQEDFEIEVASAGLSNPFRVLKQYEKNIGNEVELLKADGVKLKGVLIAATDDLVTIEIESKIKPEGSKKKVLVKELVEIDKVNIKSTTLIISFK